MQPAPSPARLPRVRFEGDVLIKDKTRERPIRAQARNLSARGIAITTEHPPQQGEEIECRVHIGGQRRYLRGRVAWVRKEVEGERRLPDAGIEFVELAASDRELLNEIVAGADDGAEAVDVWVDGMAHPLRMRGLVTTEELKLGFKLPRLHAGSPLHVRFAHRGVTEERAGTVTAIKLLPGDADSVARLIVQVATPRPDHDRGALGAMDDVTQIDRPARQAPESVLVDLASLAPLVEEAPAAPRGHAEAHGEVSSGNHVDLSSGDHVDRTVVVRAPARRRAHSRSLRVWQIGAAGALALGLLAGGAWGRWSRPPAPIVVVPPAREAPALRAPAAPPITIEPIAPQRPRRR